VALGRSWSCSSSYRQNVVTVGAGRSSRSARFATSSELLHQLNLLYNMPSECCDEYKLIQLCRRSSVWCFAFYIWVNSRSRHGSARSLGDSCTQTHINFLIFSPDTFNHTSLFTPYVLCLLFSCDMSTHFYTNIWMDGYGYGSICVNSCIICLVNRSVL